MKLDIAIKSLSVAAALALGGCMTPGEDRPANAEAVRFVQESTAPIAKSAAPGAGAPHEAIAAELKKIGCPKLAALFTDMATYNGIDPLPTSFNDYLSCFGLSANPTVEDFDAMNEKFKNPQELLGCICGGDGLADLLAGKFDVFNAQASTAAGASFSAASSSTTGAAFTGSSSSASGKGYTGGDSKVTGNTFSGQ